MAALFTRFELSLRIFVGLILIISVIVCGYQGRPLIIIANFSVVFSLLYFMGKKGACTALLSRGVVGLIKLLVPTILIQSILCCVLYFVGRGIGSVSGIFYDTVASPYDFLIPASVFVVCALSTSILSLIGRKEPEIMNEPVSSAPFYGKAEYTMLFDEGPITPDNFFTGLYYRNNRAAQNITTPDMIAEAEARLGIVLPPLLRSLYMRQNGGRVGNLWVAAVENPTLDYKDWRGVFSHDYCNLMPLDKLCTLHDSYLYCMTEEEIAEDNSLQKDAKRYIILCQRYMDTTFLDYSQSNDNPRVGVIDFDGINKQNKWFESFDAFFAALKRGNLE